MKNYFRIIILILLCFLLAGCIVTKNREVPSVNQSGAAVFAAAEPNLKQEPTLEPTPLRITLVAVGDNLLHLPIVNRCKTADSYDFTPLYQEVKELVSAADMAFVNQESPLGGEGFAPSGYPKFNSPQLAGQALADTGFSIISQANNHALDQGAKALLATADFWHTVPGVVAIGINRSEEERAEITVVEVQGYRFAWLAYSYGTNGMPLPSSYLLNVINKDTMAADINKAQAVSDAVIVSLHWGNEYQLAPSREQRELAQFLADQGVMLIIGHHPHVAQPLEWVEGKGGGATLVIYSLGNFISSQNRRDTMLGGMLQVAFAATTAGVVINDYGIIPLVTHYEFGFTAYSVHPLFAYTENMAQRHYVNQLDKPLSLDYFHNLANDIWGENCIIH